MKDANIDDGEVLDNELHKAILDEDYDLVEKLLTDGADANSCDDLGNSALFNACSTNNYELVQLIIDYADINDSDVTCSALYATDDQDIIDLLFTHGAFRDISYYESCRYYANYEMVFGFDNAFRDEVITKTLKLYHINVDDLLVEEDDLEYADEGVFHDLWVLGVQSIKNGKLEVDYNTDHSDTYALNDLLDKLGYDVVYEGSNNKLEGQIGIYFVE